MDYRDVAYGYVSGLGFVQLQWNPDGRVKATQVFTAEIAESCEKCDEPIPDGDADPDEVLRRLARCHDQLLFGHCDWWVYACWGTDSMYRRARHGADLRLTADELLAVLLGAARSDAWRLDVRYYEAPCAWDAYLWAAQPGSTTDWFGPVLVDAGHVRTMLRAADHLMPPSREGAELLARLLSNERAAAFEAVENLTPDVADRILRYAAFGREVAR